VLRTGDVRAAAAELAGEVDVARLRERVAALPAPRSSLHSPDRMRAAADLVESWFAAAGLAAERQPVSVTGVTGYRDHEPFDKVRYDRLDGVNVLATQPGLASEAIVLLAHYDTVRDSPGADDNTASVVALAEVAHLLAARSPYRTVVYAVTDLEELGFFGAYALADLLATRHRVRLAVNFECLAYTDPAPGSQRMSKGLGLLYPRQVAWIRRRGQRGDFTALLHNRAATGPVRLLRRALAGSGVASVALADPNGLPLVGGWIRRNVRGARNFRRSDHVAFWDRDIPAVQLTDTADLRYPHYHRPTDTVDRLDLVRVRDIVAATAAVIGHLAG